MLKYLINHLPFKKTILAGLSTLVMGLGSCGNPATDSFYEDAKQEDVNPEEVSQQNDADASLDLEQICTPKYRDSDGDGYGNPKETSSKCNLPDWYVENNLDCDDNYKKINPDAKELCNNIDDNCDGKIDNDVQTEQCKNSNEYGTCYGKKSCSEGEWSCDALVPIKEICDSLDNNCNDQIDESFPNLGKSCSVGVGSCNSSGIYVCSADKETTVCNVTPKQPTEEKCNGLDDNCDGLTDEDLTQACSTICSNGIEYCVGGQWKDCSAPVPISEICDGKDNDCNGKIDEELIKIIPCGENNQGEQQQICNNGQWQNEGGCIECLEGIVEKQSCETDNPCKSYQIRKCVGGKWGKWEECVYLEKLIDGDSLFGQPISSPKIFGDKIAFKVGKSGESGGLYMFDIFSKELTFIATLEIYNSVGFIGDDQFDISEKGIIYRAPIGEAKEICGAISPQGLLNFYNFGTKIITPINFEGELMDFRDPSIDPGGDIVYISVDFTEESCIGSLFFMNLFNGIIQQLIDSDPNPFFNGLQIMNPKIYGNTVAYISNDNSSSAVKFLDLVTGELKTVSEPIVGVYTNDHISLNNDYLAFFNYVGGVESELWLYSIIEDKTKKISSGFGQSGPSIWKNNLIYSQAIGDLSLDLMIYNITSEQSAKISEGNASGKCINSEKIIFTKYDTPQSSDIYLCELKDKWIN